MVTCVTLRSRTGPAKVWHWKTTGSLEGLQTNHFWSKKENHFSIKQTKKENRCVASTKCRKTLIETNTNMMSVQSGGCRNGKAKYTITERMIYFIFLSGSPVLDLDGCAGSVSGLPV